MTIRYTGKVAGHPEPQSQVTVERTALVDALLAAGYAVVVERPKHATGGIITEPTLVSEPDRAEFIMPLGADD